MLKNIDALIREIRLARDAAKKEENAESAKRREVDNDDVVMEDAEGQKQHYQPCKKTKQSTHNPAAPAVPIQSCMTNASSTGSSTDVANNEELERIVRDAATVLSNSRPPSSFVVYNRDAQRPINHTKQNRGEDNDEIADYEGDEAQHGPPLFDGSVANATPGHASGGGGGSGTALHLCCALDSPFIFAILLAMGGDSSSRHTAFRRLIVHEAACADSPSCLRLLLELGDEFGPGMFPDRPVVDGPNNGERGEAKQKKGLPIHNFFSGWGKSRNIPPTTTLSSSPSSRVCARSISAAATTPSYRQFRAAPVPSLSSSLKNHVIIDTASAASTQKPQEHSTSFIATLRLALQLARSIRSGATNEMDAARQLLSAVSLPETSKIAIASSCYVAPTPGDHQGVAAPAVFSSSSRSPLARPPSSMSSTTSFFSPLPTTVPQPNANADGHGNTPLHWASFKNAADCVSVLLAHRANPSARAYPSGWTPLHDAAYSDAHRAVSLLLEAGAEVDARANSGATPLCFAAQEDAPGAAELLLGAGADPAVRCCGHNGSSAAGGQNGYAAAVTPHHHHHHASRFSGYTPLHYCAHYNASRAAHVLLEKSAAAKTLLEIPDLNDKFPIHVAVARGSSDVLRELLHGGARVDAAPSAMISEEEGSVSGQGSPDTENLVAPPSPTAGNVGIVNNATAGATSVPLAIINTAPSSPVSQQSPAVITPVSSPVLRQLIPSRPITSSKPWNCLSQKAIDECRNLISEAEMNWTPDRHALFSPTDRRAVVEVLRVGKRLEQMGTGIFLELWPYVLNFCGRGWFEMKNMDAMDEDENENQQKPASSRERQRDRSSSSSLGDAMEFTQFHLDR